MAKGWKCERCSTENGEGTLNCSRCGLIRGGVVVPGSYTPPAEGPASVPAAAEGVGPSAWLSGDATVAPDVAPSVPTPLRRRISSRFLIFALIVIVAAVGGWYLNASRSGSGEITRGGDLTATDLRVGDCFDLKDPAADQIDQVTARPCTDEHEFEMFFFSSMPEGAYPANDAFTSFIGDACTPAFDAYIGKPYADSELDIFWLTPTRDSWADGDRSIQCAAYHPRVHRLTTSLKGSAR